MIKLVIFDLSGICFNEEDPIFIRNLTKKHNIDYAEFIERHSHLLKSAEKGKGTGKGVWKKLSDEYKITLNPEKTIRKIVSLKKQYRESMEIVKKVRKNYKTAFYTNYSGDHWKEFSKKYSIRPYFDFGIVSYEIKSRKPAHKGFRTIMKKFSVKPEETLYIDDSLKNTESAVRLGINTIHLRNHKDLKKKLKESGIVLEETKKEKYSLARKLAERKWYIQGFNAVPLLLNHGGESATRTTWNEAGYGYQYILNTYENDFSEMFYDFESLRNIYSEIMRRTAKDKNYVDSLIAKSRKEEKWVNRVIEKIYKTDLRKTKNKKLLELFSEINEAYPYTVSTSHLIEGFTLCSDGELKKLLYRKVEKKGRQKEFSKIFSAIVTPSRRSNLSKEEESMQKICRYIISIPKLRKIFSGKISTIRESLKTNTKLKSMLSEHQKKYYWVKASYARSPVLKVEDFAKEARSLISSGKVKSKKRANGNMLKSSRIIKEIGIKGKLLELITLTDKFGIWQDERKKTILQCTCHIELVVAEISKRYKIRKELLYYLLPHEFSDENLKSMKSSRLKERKKGCIIIYGHDKMLRRVYMDKDYALVKKELYRNRKKEEMKELNGISACLGKAIGKVQICRTLDEIKKFREGNILVTMMTRPEFLPAIKKAAAIVTSEGGVSSHAAIISRELGIPCIIGTKIATKVFNEGDFVEVNANHSLIKIIKRAKTRKE